MSTFAFVAIMMMVLVAAVTAARAKSWATARTRRREIAARRAALVEAHLELVRDRRMARADRAERFTREGRPASVR